MPLYVLRKMMLAPVHNALKKKKEDMEVPDWGFLRMSLDRFR